MVSVPVLAVDSNWSKVSINCLDSPTNVWTVIGRMSPICNIFTLTKVDHVFYIVEYYFYIVSIKYRTLNQSESNMLIIVSDVHQFCVCDDPLFYPNDGLI